MDNETLKRKKEAELKLSGELQKSVWAILWREKKERIKNIAVKLGRGTSDIYNVMEKLIEYDMVVRVERGVYGVSDKILGKKDI